MLDKYWNSSWCHLVLPICFGSWTLVCSFYNVNSKCYPYWQDESPAFGSIVGTLYIILVLIITFFRLVLFPLIQIFSYFGIEQHTGSTKMMGGVDTMPRGFKTKYTFYGNRIHLVYVLLTLVFAITAVYTLFVNLSEIYFLLPIYSLYLEYFQGSLYKMNFVVTDWQTSNIFNNYNDLQSLQIVSAICYVKIGWTFNTYLYESYQHGGFIVVNGFELTLMGIFVILMQFGVFYVVSLSRGIEELFYHEYVNFGHSQNARYVTPVQYKTISMTTLNYC